MKRKTVLGLQLVMGIVCIFHIGMGLGLNVSRGFVEAAAKMYGAEVGEWSPQFLYILKPLGVFMFALGILAGAAALRPLEHRVTIYVFAGIFIARALQRAVFGSEVDDIFGIGGNRNLINMIFFFSLAALLIVLDLLARRSTGPAKQPAST